MSFNASYGPQESNKDIFLEKTFITVGPLSAWIYGTFILLLIQFFLVDNPSHERCTANALHFLCKGSMDTSKVVKKDTTHLLSDSSVCDEHHMDRHSSVRHDNDFHR